MFSTLMLAGDTVVMVLVKPLISVCAFPVSNGLQCMHLPFLACHAASTTCSQASAASNMMQEASCGVPDRQGLVEDAKDEHL